MKLIFNCLFSCALLCGKVVALNNIFIDGTIKNSRNSYVFLVDDSDHFKVDSSAISCVNLFQDGTATTKKPTAMP